jgi:two-component system, OmpR family, sensor kinase
LPIRARLTAAFALALMLVLAGAGLFVYLRLRADLDDSVNATLRTRADAVAARQSGDEPAVMRGIALEDREESFVQLLSPTGRVLDSVGSARDPALSRSEIRRAARETVKVERRSVPGIDGPARLLARPATSDAGPVVVAVGQSLNDRDEALAGVVTSFAVGGAVAILLASGIGYLLASAGLAPVEAMRRRAREVSLTRAGSDYRCLERTTRCAGSARRSTRCWTGCDAPSSANVASWPTRAMSFAPQSR